MIDAVSRSKQLNNKQLCLINILRLVFLLQVLLFSTNIPAKVRFDSWHTYTDQLDIGSRIEVSKAANPMSAIYFNMHKAAAPSAKGGPYPYSGVSFTVQGKHLDLDDDMEISVVYRSKGQLWLILEQDGVDAGNGYYVELPSAADFRHVNIKLSAFKFPAWVSNPVNIYKHKLSAIKFQLPGNESSNAELWVKSVALVSSRQHALSKHVAWKTVSTKGDSENVHRHENGFIGKNNTFYLIGGRGSVPEKPKATMMLDVAQAKWVKRSAPPVDMHHIQPVRYKNKIYVLAGYTGRCCDEKTLEYIYIYEPKSDRWIRGPRIPEQFRRGAAGVVVVNGKFYVGGGIIGGHHNDRTTALRYFDQYDPETDRWVRLQDMPRVRDHFHAVTVDSQIYLIGGRDTSAPDNSRTVNEIDVYDTLAQVWKTLPQSTDIPTPRSGASYVLHKQRIYVIGGESLDTVHDITEIFDTGKLTWKTGSRLNIPRHGTQAALRGNSIYLPAGAIDILVNETDTMESLQLE